VGVRKKKRIPRSAKHLFQVRILPRLWNPLPPHFHRPSCSRHLLSFFHVPVSRWICCFTPITSQTNTIFFFRSDTWKWNDHRRIWDENRAFSLLFRRGCVAFCVHCVRFGIVDRPDDFNDAESIAFGCYYVACVVWN
jgi:hypothetical protein